MSLFTVATFLGLLSLVAFAGVLAALVLWALGRIGLGTVTADSLGEAVRPFGPWLAFVIALTAMSGSLYFSEVAHLVPCTLCWYQRIAMYPLAPILGIAAVRRDLGVRIYAWVLAGSGAVISIYHYMIQWVPDLDATACAVDNPCTAVFVREFGFVSIPFMALAGFLAISALLWAATTAATNDEGRPRAGPRRRGVTRSMQTTTATGDAR